MCFSVVFDETLSRHTKGLSHHLCAYLHSLFFPPSKTAFSFKCMQKWLKGMHQQTQQATTENAGDVRADNVFSTF